MPFGDPRIDPFVDDNVVRTNHILGNGLDPDPLAFAAGDIVFVPDVVNPFTGMVILNDPDPTDNCFANNAFEFDFPPGIVDLFPCLPNR